MSRNPYPTDVTPLEAHEVYEEAGALAELLPPGQRERYAALLLSLAQDLTEAQQAVPTGSDPEPDAANGIRRWARDAGYLPRE